MFFFSKFLNKINVFITCVEKKHPRFYLYYSLFSSCKAITCKYDHENVYRAVIFPLNLRSTNVIYILNEYTYHLHYYDQLNTSFLMGGVS